MHTKIEPVYSGAPATTRVYTPGPIPGMSKNAGCGGKCWRNSGECCGGGGEKYATTLLLGLGLGHALHTPAYTHDPPIHVWVGGDRLFFFFFLSIYLLALLLLFFDGNGRLEMNADKGINTASSMTQLNTSFK